MFKIVKIYIFTLFFILGTAYAESEIRNIKNIKNAIVTINTRVSLSAYASKGSWSGTGFIVDKKNGYLVTNNHVSGKASIGTYLVTFNNGQQADARLVYYDAYADFAILKVNPNDFPQESHFIKFSRTVPKVGDPLFVVGNTEAQGFSFHNGYLSDLYAINGEMPQGSFVINLNSTGGSSGSPVLDINNNAVGILYGGGKTYVLAAKSYYVEHILRQLQSGKTPIRKHMGVITELYSLDKAVKHRNFPKKRMESYIKDFPDARNRVVVVHSTIKGTTSESVLQPGDILLSINGKLIGPDLALFEKYMNDSTDSKVKLEIIRNGQKLTNQVPLYDTDDHKIFRMLNFAGGVFFEADDFVAAKSGIPVGSVALVHAETGSSFSTIPEIINSKMYRVRIKSFNGTKIKSLDDLINVTSISIKKKYVNLEYQNFNPYYSSFAQAVISGHENLIHDITFDSIDTKPRVLEFDNKVFEWIANDK